MIDPNVMLPIKTIDVPEAGDVADPSATNALAQMENRYAVRQMMSAVSSEDAEVLHLIYWREMSLADAGRVLGLTKVAVMKRRDKALARMAELAVS